MRGHNEMDFFLDLFEALKLSVSEASGKAVGPVLDLTGSGDAIDIHGATHFTFRWPY